MAIPAAPPADIPPFDLLEADAEGLPSEGDAPGAEDVGIKGVEPGTLT